MISKTLLDFIGLAGLALLPLACLQLKTRPGSALLLVGALMLLAGRLTSISLDHYFLGAGIVTFKTAATCKIFASTALALGTAAFAYGMRLLQLDQLKPAGRIPANN